MFDIGFWELILTAIVALVVVGPERLPKVVRVTGLWLGRINAQFQSVKNDISRELRAEELRQALQDYDEKMKNQPSEASSDSESTNTRDKDATH